MLKELIIKTSSLFVDAREYANDFGLFIYEIQPRSILTGERI